MCGCLPDFIGTLICILILCLLLIIQCICRYLFVKNEGTCSDGVSDCLPDFIGTLTCILILCLLLIIQCICRYYFVKMEVIVVMVCVTVYLTILELCVMSTCVNTSLVKMKALVLQDPVFVHQDGPASMY